MGPHDATAGRRSAAPAAKLPHVDGLFAAQRAALDELIAGIDADARWVLLVAPDGSGKSTVVEALLDELRRVAATVAVFEAPKTPDVAQLAGRLRDQLGLPRTRKFLGDEYSVSDI